MKQKKLTVTGPVGSLVAAALAAALYAFLAIRDVVPISWPIFAGWLVLLTAANGWVVGSVWMKWDTYEISRRLFAVLWIGIAVWYWTAAPLYYWLIANVNQKQLAWTALAFFWEVPVIGGLVFVAGSWLMFWPIMRQLENKLEIIARKRLYARTLEFPLRVAVLLFLTSVVGYVIGAWQLGTFAGWPPIEQIKNVINGAVVSLFPAVFFYLGLDAMLEPVRRQLRGKDLGEGWSSRSLRRRTAGVVAAVVIGSLGVMGLVTFETLQLAADRSQTPEIVDLLFSSEVMLKFGIGVVIVFATIMVVIMIAARAITRALRTLTIQATRPVEARENSSVIHTGDEIEVLSRAFQNKVADLQRGAAQLNAVIDSMGEGLVVTDAAGRVILINRQAEYQTGWVAKRVQGRDWQRLVKVARDGASAGKFHNPIKKALEEGLGIRSRSMLYTGREGNVYPVAMTVTPLFGDGKVAGAVIVFRDITEEKAIDRSRREFVSLASHQLRTPLTIIRWYLEKLGRFRLAMSAKQRAYLDELEGSSQRMSSLVGDLLNLSRLESGRLRIEPVAQNLKALVTKITSEILPLAKKNQCRLIIRVRGKAWPWVPVDELVFREVLYNVLSNAVKYTKAGKGVVKVEMQQTADEYVISVNDNGIGIAEEEKNKVFDKFYRTERAKKVAAEGTGLGLHVARESLRQAGGRIWFESIKGRGATFYIGIPKSGMKASAGEIGLAI